MRLHRLGLTVGLLSVSCLLASKHNNQQMEMAYECLSSSIPASELFPGELDLTGALPGVFDVLEPSMVHSAALAQEEITVRVQEAFSQGVELWDKNRCAMQWRSAHGFHAWVMPVADFTRQGVSNVGQVAAWGSGVGIVAGVDVKILHHLYLGVGGAYTHTHLSWENLRGTGHVNSYYGAVYAEWMDDLFFTELMVLYAGNNYQGDRRITQKLNPFSLLNQKTYQKHHGHELAGYWSGGATIHTPSGSDWSPFVSLDYIYLHEQGYQEGGGSVLALSVQPSHSDLLRAAAGFMVSRCVKLDWGRIVSDLNVSYVREQRFAGDDTRGEFLAAPACSFTVKNLNPSRNLFVPSLGFSYLSHGSHFSVTVRYNGAFGPRYQDNGATLQLGINY